MDRERFGMLFQYLSPMSFGDHINVISDRVFNVSVEYMYMYIYPQIKDCLYYKPGGVYIH